VNTLADLDELVLSCRSTSAKAYIAEAVSSYRSAAYRSAIVATWVAVVYDFIDKLKELEMSGDANATRKVADFEKWRQASDLRAFLKFESEVIALAQDEFELLSPVEAIDLKRLLEDRNRCAHPSMASPEEPYNPTAELARTHIKNAVSHLLSHPPVQGKAALERLMKEIESQYFPTDASKAKEFFKTGPLARAREALVRNFVIAILKTLLFDPYASIPRKQRYAALNAVLAMYGLQAERTMKDQLPRLIGSVPDDKWYRVLFLLGSVGGSWEFIGHAAEMKAPAYVEKAPDDAFFKFVPYAIRIPALRPFAIDRLPKANLEALARVVAVDASPEIKDEVMTRFESAGSFRNAEKVFQTLVLPISSALQKPDLERIAKAFVKNNQIAYAARIPGLLLQLIEGDPLLLMSTKSAWKPIHDMLAEEHEAIPEGKALREKLKKECGF
jgi:hypothetical protein